MTKENTHACKTRACRKRKNSARVLRMHWSLQGSKFKFEFGSTCANRCKFRLTAEILGAQLKI